jgi:hypothetical protein
MFIFLAGAWAVRAGGCAQSVADTPFDHNSAALRDKEPGDQVDQGLCCVARRIASVVVALAGRTWPIAILALLRKDCIIKSRDQTPRP